MTAKRFLIITKIAAVAAAILAMPLLFIGVGLVIVPALLFYVLAVDRITNPKPASDARKILGFTPQSVACIATLAAGFGSFVALYTLGSLGHLDTTSRPSDSFVAASAAVCVIVTVSILFAINRTPKQELKT